MKIRIRESLVIIVLFILSIGFIPSPSHSQNFVNRSLCIYSPVGKAGPITNVMNKYRARAMKWGVRFNINIYSDELVALEDMQAGQCDAVLLTDIRSRQLVRFAGGFSQAGALPTFKHFKKAVAALSRPKASQYVKEGKYEAVGFFPIGRVYFFVRPEVMNNVGRQMTLDDLAGKRFAILSYDEQSRAAAKRLGTSIVNADVTNLFGMFNNGSVDMIYAPASAYQPLELYKGLGEDGRIVKEPPLAMSAFVITIKQDRFPKNFGKKSRKFSKQMFGFVRRMALSYRSKIPNEYWLDLPQGLNEKVNGILRDLRQEFTEKGVYDPRMTQLFRNIRCNIDPSRAECA